MADDLTSRAMYLRSMASVKAQEGNFVKGAAVGAVASVPRALGAITDMVGITEGAERDIRNHWQDKVDGSQPGAMAGFDFGSVLGDAAQTVSPAAPAVFIPARLLPAETRAARKVVQWGGDELVDINFMDSPVIVDKIRTATSKVTIPLKEVLPHTELEAYLPDLYKKTTIVVDDFVGNPTMKAEWDDLGEVASATIRIPLEQAWRLGPEAIGSIVVHETQHAVQAITNMASLGTNPTYVKRKLVSAWQAFNHGKPIPDDKHLEFYARQLYLSNVGEQMARKAETLAGFTEATRQRPPETEWVDDTLNTIWTRYQDIVKRYDKLKEQIGRVE
jgi:hypothetical protein